MEDNGALVLKRAKLVLETRGWRQGLSSSGDTGPVCTLYAVELACDELFPDTSGTKIRARLQARNRLCYSVGGRYVESIVEWNDSEKRTLEEVMQVFDKAISLNPPY